MSKDPKSIASKVTEAQKQPNLPPLDEWNPELSGDIDIRVARDGQWIYEGRPIARESVTRLFSTVLRREADGEYYLVTPVEKWRIEVEDTPLLAHSLEAEGQGEAQVLSVTTNMGEVLEIGPQHPLIMESYPETGEPRPLVEVRQGFCARLLTPAYYDLADRVVEDDKGSFGVWSHGIFYKIG